MMYPFMTLNDGTEILHSEVLTDSKIKVYIEKPDAEICFKHATCFLPDFQWDDVYGLSQDEIDKYQEIIESQAHLIYVRLGVMD